MSCVNGGDQARPLGRKIRIGVIADCGHTWTETRPPDLAPPADGEMRVCGHPDCYPRERVVRYTEPVELGRL
jgi:hypothetical protein